MAPYCKEPGLKCSDMASFS